MTLLTAQLRPWRIAERLRKPVSAKIDRMNRIQPHALWNISASRRLARGTWHSTSRIGVRISRRRVSFPRCGHFRDRFF